jgi:hypothetical protein
VTSLSVRECDSCGKALLWNAAPWPIETEPRPADSYRSRAYVFAKGRGGTVRALDVRDLPAIPDQVYPQHICPVWHARRAAEELEQTRARAILGRITG